MRNKLVLKTLSLVLSVFSFSILSACSLGNLLHPKKDVRNDLSDVRAVQAQQAASIQELQSEVRRLVGRMEELDYALVGQAQEYQANINKMAERLPPPDGVPVDLLDGDMQTSERWVNTGGLGVREGLARLRQSDFVGARAIFVEYLEVNRQSEFSDNALFWIGVCLELSGSIDNAVVAYSEVYQHYPKGDRAVDSLYYLARAYLSSATPEAAVLTLQKLVDEHPKSAYAKLAKQRISELSKTKKKK